VIPTTHVELSGNHYFDATTAQAYIAGATSTISIGSMVTILPSHNPVIAAKSIATLDWISGGRAQVTVGRLARRRVRGRRRPLPQTWSARR
jgi:alkanesulfonate monooxygenase SsuD/methylene tetrahydromethanopterin reductase-like flavin-dependent oxidoreductase (luciferase family)